VGVRTALVVLVAALGAAHAFAEGTAGDRFRRAAELAREGDYPKAIAALRELAASGQESASLYWNWAQAAAARGTHGEALWALLRARELDPGDRAVEREVERLREALNLDPAEIAPVPLAAAARLGRQYHLDLVAVALLGLSLLAHAAARLSRGARGPALMAWTTGILGLLAVALPLAGTLARPTAVVVRRGAALFDAASPTAEATSTLREGEVVPILDESGSWLRVEDNAGARGWARLADVRRLDRAPVPEAAAERSSFPPPSS
jgi:tetratricopeptide (TPR) repeat protein